MVNTQHRIDQQKYIAKAGNRTRIICLEDSYADQYTTNALLSK